MMQLEIIRLILSRAGGRGLIVCPLGVRQEFGIDAAKLGGTVRFVRRTVEVDTADGIWITNYESIRDGRRSGPVHRGQLGRGVGARSFGSKTYQTFLTLFDAVRVPARGDRYAIAEQVQRAGSTTPGSSGSWTPGKRSPGSSSGTPPRPITSRCTRTRNASSAMDQHLGGVRATAVRPRVLRRRIRSAAAGHPLA